jgi:tetratricopeptide (TPR) repeat protein
LRVSWTLSPARLRRAGHVVAFAFALIPAAPAPAQETAGAAARAHLEKGRELTTRREYDQALAELDEALRLAADGADLRLTGQIQAARGQAFYWKRDWPRMKEAYETAAALFDQAGLSATRHWPGEAIFSAALSWKEKEQIITHAAEVLRRDPDPEVEGLVLHRWGEILVNQGYYGRGLEKLELALVKLEGSTDDDARARLLTSLAAPADSTASRRRPCGTTTRPSGSRPGARTSRARLKPRTRSPSPCAIRTACETRSLIPRGPWPSPSAAASHN